ncbi:MAG: hypothetical protein AAB339_03070 [Elusimicrobiota bacterium]
MGVHQTAHLLELPLANIKESLAAFLLAIEVEGGLTASLAAAECVMRDEGAGEEDPDLQEICLKSLAILEKAVDLLAKAAGRCGIHAAMDTKPPSTNLVLTLGK